MQWVFFSLISVLIAGARVARADFAGRARLGTDHFVKTQLAPVASDESSLTLELEGKYKLTDSLRLRIEPRARFSTADKIVDAPLDADTRDTQLEGKFGNFRFQLGSFIKTWEGTDGLNPMDIASMKNLRDPLAGESLASLGLTIAGGEGFFTWDALYVPRQTPTRLPGEKSPWLPRRSTLPLEKDGFRVILPDNPVYEIQSRSEHNHALDHNGGARLQLHGKSWDFSLAGFEGAAQTPYLSPTLTSTNPNFSGPVVTIPIDNPIQIRPVDYRRRTVAGSLVYTHDTWIFRLAGRHDQPIGDNPILKISATNPSSDPALPTWSDQFVGGLEKTLTVREQSVILSLQGAYGQAPESGGVVSASDLFRRAVLLGTRWPWSDDLVFSFAGFGDVQHGGGYARLGAQKKLSDPMTLDFYADGTDGPDDSLLGVWRDQKRVGASLLYQF